ncbi:MAG: YihY/virulence factor BrkB family protein [bacterium]|jgi:membrane protein
MSTLNLFKESYQRWSDDNASQMAAALAYYTIFSLAPMLILVIAIAGVVWGEEAARGELKNQMQNIVGESSAAFLQEMISNTSKPGSSATGWATLAGVFILIWGATGVFAQLQASLNQIWGIQPKPGGYGMMARQLIRKRLTSFLVILGVGALILLSLCLSAALNFVSTQMSGSIADTSVLWNLLDFAGTFIVITLLFAMIFKVLPDAHIEWRQVWAGAVITALLFTIGKFLLGLYLGSGSVSSTFGAAGSLVLLLIWIYYSSQILFFGAEFTHTYAQQSGSPIEPEDHAMQMKS